MHRYLYNEVFVGDVGAVLGLLPRYDLVFLGDIIEHFDKATGLQVLRTAYDQANRAVILTTPKHATDQTDLCNNELERHRSLWSAKDFLSFPGAAVKTIDRATLLAVLPKPGLPTLVIGPPLRPRTADVRRLREAKEDLVRLVPLTQPFILVDEEQIRGEMPHRGAIPFLEKEGQYWGPPADDETAIRECERLRQSGAEWIAFIWTTFWWLEHYPGFLQHLRSQYRCVAENEQVLVFQFLPGDGASPGGVEAVQ
jgi:hypothetical protein